MRAKLWHRDSPHDRSLSRCTSHAAPHGRPSGSAPNSMHCGPSWSAPRQHARSSIDRHVVTIRTCNTHDARIPPTVHPRGCRPMPWSYPATGTEHAGLLARCCVASQLRLILSVPQLIECSGVTGDSPEEVSVGQPLPHLHRDWAHPCNICTGTGLTLTKSASGLGSSAPGIGSPLPHLRQDRAHPASPPLGLGSQRSHVHWGRARPSPQLHRGPCAHGPHRFHRPAPTR